MADQIINADTDPDAVDAALGLDSADEPDEQDVDTDNGDDEGNEDEPTLADVLAELRELKRSNAQLRREAAAARVAAKPAKPEGKAGADETETVEQARQAGKDEARLEYGIELAGASIKAALTGIIPETDLDDFVDDLNLTRYVNEDGRPDTDAIKALKERQAKITRRKTNTNVGHGRSSNNGHAKTKGELLDDTFTKLGI